MHFAASLHIFLKECQGPEQSTVILQDLDVIRHIPIHLKVLLGLRGTMKG